MADRQSKPSCSEMMKRPLLQKRDCGTGGGWKGVLRWNVTSKMGSSHSQHSRVHPSQKFSRPSPLTSSWDGVESELPLCVLSAEQTSCPHGDSGFLSAPCLSPNSRAFSAPPGPADS